MASRPGSMDASKLWLKTWSLGKLFGIKDDFENSKAVWSYLEIRSLELKELGGTSSLLALSIPAKEFGCTSVCFPAWDTCYISGKGSVGPRLCEGGGLPSRSPPEALTWGSCSCCLGSPLTVLMPCWFINITLCPLSIDFFLCTVLFAFLAWKVQL